MVALLIPFSYDKRLAQHWTIHNWYIHWHSWLKIRHICQKGTF